VSEDVAGGAPESQATELPLDAPDAEEQAVLDAAAELDDERPAIADELAEFAEVLEVVAGKDGRPPDEVLAGLADRLSTIAEGDDGTFGEALEELARALAELVGRAPTLSAEETLELEQAVELEKAREAYERKVRKIRGPEAVLVGCEHCNATGFDMSGGHAEPELLSHPNYRQCEECGGACEVKTGARVGPELTIKCPGCGGRGYKELLEANDPRNTAAANGDGEPQYGLPSWMGDPSLDAPGAAVR
jgi:hypothetical protein